VRRSSVLVLAGALLAIGAIAALALRADGDSGGATGDLTWAQGPRVFAPPRLPQDRILSASLRNDSLRRVRLGAEELRLEDASGRRVDATAVFLESFVHGLYPPTRQPPEVSESELRRTGRLAVIDPGESVPLTVAWRPPRDVEAPLRLDYGFGSLPVPSG